MSAPIQAGDLAEVISGVLGEHSPNKGLIVKVLSYVGDDPFYGRIWRCEAEFAEQWRFHPDAVPTQQISVPPGVADFAQSWLKKIEPPQQASSAHTNLPQEITA